MRRFTFVLCLVTFFIVVVHGLDITPDTILGETSKLQKAQEIFQSIKDSDFVKTTKAVSKWGLPLLKSIGYFAKVILAQFETDSKELVFMKEQFKIINQKMDFVDHQFDEVKRAIDWNVVKVQYSNYEMSIGLLQNMIQDISDAPVNVRPVMLNRFYITYAQTYYDASYKLYESIVNQQRIFSENLILASRKYLQDHKGKVEQFFMANINLMFKGLEVETFYITSRNLSANQDFWSEQWNKRLNQITEIMQRTSDDIKSKWHSQLEQDAETFNVNNYQKDNRQYLADFTNFLYDKFPWREWFVVIYNPISSGDNHYVYLSGGIIKFRARGHNIIVGSREVTQTNFNVNAVDAVLNGLPRNVFRSGKGLAEALLLDHLVPRLQNVQPFSLAAVIEYGAGVWYSGKQQFRSYKKWDGFERTFNVIVMG